MSEALRLYSILYRKQIHVVGCNITPFYNSKQKLSFQDKRQLEPNFVEKSNIYFVNQPVYCTIAMIIVPVITLVFVVCDMITAYNGVYPKTQ